MNATRIVQKIFFFGGTRLTKHGLAPNMINKDFRLL